MSKARRTDCRACRGIYRLMLNLSHREGYRRILDPREARARWRAAAELRALHESNGFRERGPGAPAEWVGPRTMRALDILEGRA